MNTTHPVFLIPRAVPETWQSLQRNISIVLVILLHISLFYLLQKGLLQNTPTEPAISKPKEIVVSLISLSTSPTTLTPTRSISQPAHKKTKITPVIQKTSVVPHLTKPAVAHSPVKTPSIVIPTTNTTPSEKAVNVPLPLPTEATSNNASTEKTPAVPAETISKPAQPAEKTYDLSHPKTISSVGYIRKPTPEYPPLSKRLNEEGTVIIRVLINETGSPEKATVQKSSGFNRLDEAARTAALEGIYKPYIENGKAIPISAAIPLNFKLDEDNNE